MVFLLLAAAAAAAAAACQKKKNVSKIYFTELRSYLFHGNAERAVGLAEFFSHERAHSTLDSAADSVPSKCST